LKKFLSIGLLCFFAAIVISACKKDKNVLGVSSQPGSDALDGQFDDSSPVYGYSKKTDSIISYNISRFKFLGSNNDPYFGKVDIGLYLNGNMDVSNLTFGDTSKLKLMSAEIVLAVDPDNTSGNINSKLTYSVYAIDSALSSSRLYYTSNNRLHREAALNKVSSSTYTISANGTPVIHIPIDSAFASVLLKSPERMTDNNVFQSYYKGFYIKCSTPPGTEGVIYHCDLENDASGFFLYYKSPSADTVQNYRFKFSGSSAVRFNTLKTDYSSASQSLQKQILQKDSTQGAENIFLKGMGISGAKILLPQLKNYADSFKVSVNRAELVLYRDLSFSSATHYNYPLKLTLWPLDSTGKLASGAIADASDLSRFDGGFDSDNSRYVFNIARYVQAVLSGKQKNYGLYLMVSDTDPTYTLFTDLYIERVVLHGSNKGAFRPKLNMSFIKFRKD
jgi:hypothetical protein